ncbi:MAG: hypothetical protein ACJ8IK_15285 [Burkholderiaceae bacterium]|jgi:hypothetical protein
MKLPLHTVAALIVDGVTFSPVVQASKPKTGVQQAIEAYQSTDAYTVPAAGTVEVAFSPNEGSECP